MIREDQIALTVFAGVSVAGNHVVVIRFPADANSADDGSHYVSLDPDQADAAAQALTVCADAIRGERPQ